MIIQRVKSIQFLEQADIDEIVELVQLNASIYSFPDKVNGIISTFAITLIPEYEGIIRRGADRWPLRIVKQMVWTTHPFGTALIPPNVCSSWHWEMFFGNTRHLKRSDGFVFITTGQKI